MNDEAVYRTAPATPGLLKSNFNQKAPILRNSKLCLRFEIDVATPSSVPISCPVRIIHGLEVSKRHKYKNSPMAQSF